MQREPDLNYTPSGIISFGKWAILKGGGEEEAVQGRVQKHAQRNVRELTLPG